MIASDEISQQKIDVAVKQNQWLFNTYKYDKVKEVQDVANKVLQVSGKIGPITSPEFAHAVMIYQTEMMGIPLNNADGQFDPELIRKIGEKIGIKKTVFDNAWKKILGSNYLGERWIDRREEKKSEIERFQSPMLSAKIIGDYSGGKQSDPNHPGGHFGVDLSAAKGTTVYPIASGTVISAGQNPKGGNFVKIQHDGEYVSYYAHLETIAINNGDKVTQETKIGTCGDTGSAGKLGTQPHVHLQASKAGQHVNPVSIFGQPVSVNQILAASRKVRMNLIEKIAAATRKAK